MDEDRRRMLTLMGAAGVAATAGCSQGGFGAGRSEPARYSDFLAADSVEDETIGAFSFDWEGLNDVGGTETPDGGGTPDEDGTPTPDTSPTPGAGSPDSDLLAVYPVSALVTVVFGLGFASNFLGLGVLVESDGPTERIHLVDDGFAFEGTFDTESITEDLTDAGGERVTEHEGVPLYEAGGSETEVTVAVSEELIVLALSSQDSDTTATTRRLLDSEAGRVDRYREADSAFDRLVSRFEPGLIETALFAPEGDVRESDDQGELSVTEIDLEGEIVGLSSRATLSESEYVSELALLFASADEVPAETDVEAELGTAATDREVTIEDRLVVVSGTYRETPDDAPLA